MVDCAGDWRGDRGGVGLVGYNMNQAESEFHIAALDKGPALSALKGMVANGAKFMWVTNTEVLEADSLREALVAWGWRPKIHHESGDVVNIQFEAEKIGDEEQLFAVLAPFIAPGSYIEMVGEDGDRWRWVFDGTTCQTVRAKVSWE